MVSGISQLVQIDRKDERGMERKLREKLPGGVFKGVSETRSRTMSAIRGKHAKSTETRLRMALIRARIKGWTLHATDLPGKPDFIFPNRQFAIFVDGCFWHGCSTCGHIPKTNTEFWTAKIHRNIERDQRNIKALRKLDWTVLRIWEHSLKNKLAMALVIKSIQKRLSIDPSD